MSWPGSNNLDSVTAPTLPSGITTSGGTFTTSTTGATSAPNSLAFAPQSTEGIVILTGVVNPTADSLRAVRTVRLGAMGIEGAIQAKILLSDSTGYAGVGGGYVGLLMARDNISGVSRNYVMLYSSAGNVMLHADSTASGMLPLNISFKVHVIKNGTTVQFKVQRLDNGQYLTAGGGSYSWGATEVWLYNDEPTTDVPDCVRVETAAYNHWDGGGSPGTVYIDDLDDLDAVDALDGGTIVQSTIGATRAILTQSTAASGGASPYAYQWQIDTGSGYNDIPGATNGSAVTITGLTPGASYSVRRKVTDNASDVAYSDVETFTMGAALSGGTIASGTITSTTAQLANSVAASGGGGSITYQWQRKLTSGGSYANVSGATSATLTDTGLTASTGYTYKRIATDAEGTSVDSNEVAITTSAPAALDGGTIAAGTITHVTASFTSSAPASGGSGSISYQWYRKLTVGGSYAAISGATAETLSDSGLTPETGYTYKRTATDGASATADSNAVAITTDAEPTVGRLNIEAATGLTITATIKHENGTVYDPVTETFITPIASLDTYGIALTEIVTGYYAAMEPDLGEEYYPVTYYNSSGQPIGAGGLDNRVLSGLSTTQDTKLSEAHAAITSTGVLIANDAITAATLATDARTALADAILTRDYASIPGSIAKFSLYSILCMMQNWSRNTSTKKFTASKPDDSAQYTASYTESGGAITEVTPD